MKMQDSTMSKCFFMMKLTEPDTVNMECSCSVPGKRKPVKALWTEYKSKETMLDDTVSRNLRLWEKEMTKSEEKS